FPGDLTHSKSETAAETDNSAVRRLASPVDSNRLRTDSWAQAAPEDSMIKMLAKIHRRSFVSGLVGGAAAAGLTNSVLAPTPGPVPCQVGPPPHVKGPRVWMDMDQIEIDAAYDQAFYAPMGNQIAKRIASTSEAVRARLGEPLRLAYGPSEIEKLDIYR